MAAQLEAGTQAVVVAGSGARGFFGDGRIIFFFYAFRCFGWWFNLLRHTVPHEIRGPYDILAPAPEVEP